MVGLLPRRRDNLFGEASQLVVGEFKGRPGLLSGSRLGLWV
ncbi:MAG: hypothetical protein QXO71_02455 [Candidatus Jordarchaeaceae archaeon]